MRILNRLLAISVLASVLGSCYVETRRPRYAYRHHDECHHGECYRRY